MLREGDTLVVWKPDRLGRSVKRLVDLVGEFNKQAVQFKSPADSIDAGHAVRPVLLPRTPSGCFVATSTHLCMIQRIGLRSHDKKIIRPFFYAV
jgi:hypothetical protein